MKPSNIPEINFEPRTVGYAQVARTVDMLIRLGAKELKIQKLQYEQYSITTNDYKPGEANNGR